MYIYRITRANDKILPEMGKNNRDLKAIHNDKFYFSKKVVKTTKTKEHETFKEFEEFITEYRKITTKGSYDKKLISKYKEKIKTYTHESIMNNLKQYKLYLEIHKNRPPLQPATFINQNRFLDDWDIVEDISRKWLYELFKERNLKVDVIDNVISKINKRENSMKKEVSRGVAENLIHYVLTGEIL